MKQFEDLNNNPDAVTIFINGQLTKILPVQMNPVNLKDHVHIQIGRTQVGGAKTVEGEGNERAPPFQAHIVINSPQQAEVEDGKEKKREIMQLPDQALPGLMIHCLHLLLNK